MTKKSWTISACLATLSLGIGSIQAQSYVRGATQMPYTRYESEKGSLNGGAQLQQSLQFNQADIASEASNQQYVSLPANGAYVEWTLTTPGDGVTLRFTMPDNSNGLGLNGSLSVYVNGTKTLAVPLSSYHAYQYFPTGGSNPQETISDKTFMRFDEVHFQLPAKLNAGDKLRIEKDNGDAITYGVDFIELENVPAPLPEPANFLSVTDAAYGAVPNDSTVDNIPAFNSCIAAAVAQNKGVYIPAGTFYLNDKLTLDVSNLKIQGAGIWSTEIYFKNPAVFSGGIYARATGVEISNFYMNTANHDRSINGNQQIYKAFMGTYGSNSSIHDIWEEHFECGFWLGGYDPPYPVDITDHLTIANCRIRNNYADGVNCCQGTSNCLITQCSFRNNGDDGMAIWPDNSDGVAQPCMNDVFTYNTVEDNWRAGSAAIFGGYGHEISHCILKDGVAGSGIRFTNDFPGFTFDNTQAPIRIFDDSIINCGTSYDLWNEKRGAIEFYAESGISNIQFDSIDVLNAQRDGVQIWGNNLLNIVFNHISVNGTGKDGFVDNPGQNAYAGYAVYSQANTDSMVFKALAVSNAKSGVSSNINSSFKLIITQATQILPAGEAPFSAARPLEQSGRITGGDYAFPAAFLGLAKTVSIYDLDGNLLRRAIIDKNNLDVHRDLGLLNGLYILKYQSVPQALK